MTLQDAPEVPEDDKIVVPLALNTVGVSMVTGDVGVSMVTGDVGVSMVTGDVGVSMVMGDLVGAPMDSAPCMDLDDPPMPLFEVLRHAGVPWSARAVSRRFCTELEAGREALRIKWSGAGGAARAEPHRLMAMLSRLPRLTRMNGDDCPARHVMSLALPQLTDISMSDNRASNLGMLVACTALRRLDARHSHHLTDLSALGSCDNLTELLLHVCVRLVDVAPLVSCSALTTLSLRYCRSLTSINALASCKALTDLDLGLCEMLADLAPLSSCRSLARLCVQNLDLDLQPLAACTVLSWLYMGGNPRADIGPLACTSITTLIMTYCILIADTTHLQGCARLTALDLSGCSELVDISSLASYCGALRRVDLQLCPYISDIAPLAACRHLERVHVDVCNQLLMAQRLDLRQSCPNLIF